MQEKEDGDHLGQCGFQIDRRFSVRRSTSSEVLILRCICFDYIIANKLLIM